MNRPGVGVAVDRCHGTDDADAFGPGMSHCGLGARLDNVQDRDGGKVFHRLVGHGGHGVAGNDQELDFLVEEKLRDLGGVAVDGFNGFDPVGDPGRIAEIDNIFKGKSFHQGTDDGETADAGVENANGLPGGRVHKLLLAMFLRGILSSR